MEMDVFKTEWWHAMSILGMAAIAVFIFSCMVWWMEQTDPVRAAELDRALMEIEELNQRLEELKGGLP